MEDFIILKGHERTVNSGCFISDERIASGSDDGTVRIWNLEKQKTEVILKEPLEYRAAGQQPDIERVNIVAASKDGKLLAAGGMFAHTYIWDLASLTLKAKIPSWMQEFYKMEFVSNERILLSGISNKYSHDINLYEIHMFASGKEEEKAKYRNTPFEGNYSVWDFAIARKDNWRTITLPSGSMYTYPERIFCLGVLNSTNSTNCTNHAAVTSWNSYGQMISLIAESQEKYSMFYSIALDEEKYALVLGSLDGCITIIDIHSRMSIGDFKVSEKCIDQILSLPGNRVLVLTEKAVMLVDLNKGERELLFETPQKFTQKELALSPCKTKISFPIGNDIFVKKLSL
jgi:WD40 repeat protein